MRKACAAAAPHALPHFFEGVDTLTDPPAKCGEKILQREKVRDNETKMFRCRDSFPKLGKGMSERAFVQATRCTRIDPPFWQ